MVRNFIYLSIVALAAFLAGCTSEFKQEVDFKVSLSPLNTFVAGEPVRFDIEGTVDNLLFYSGEVGSRYEFRQRDTVDVSCVERAVLELSITPVYGTVEDAALSVWVTDSKDAVALSGTDFKADSVAIDKMYVKDGMDAWTRIDFEEEQSGKTIKLSKDITGFSDNFSLAIHWNPTVDPKTSTQKTYYIDGVIRREVRDAVAEDMSLLDLSPVGIIVSDGDENPANDKPYLRTGSGSIGFNMTEGQWVFQGIAKNEDKTSCYDGWIITPATALNNVKGDQGVVIKNIQNTLPSSSIR